MDIIYAEEGTDLWKETSEICMIRPLCCRIDIETFYIFKLMDGENGFGRERIEDPESFEPFLPMF